MGFIEDDDSIATDTLQVSNIREILLEQLINKGNKEVIEAIHFHSEGILEKLLWALVPLGIGILIDRFLLYLNRISKEQKREKQLKKQLDSYVGLYNCVPKVSNPNDKNPVTIEMTVSRLDSRLLISGNPSVPIGRIEGTLYMAEPDFTQGEGRYIHEEIGDGRSRYGSMRVFLNNGEILSNSEYVGPGNKIMNEGYRWQKVRNH